MANLQLTLVDGGTQQHRQRFDVTQMGATIGRSKDCDWVLHDTDRFISNKHVLITFRENSFVLSDLSSNGAFINDNDSSVGKGNTYTLQQGDIITLGKFKLQVSQLVLSNSPDNQDLMGLITSPITAAIAKPVIANTNTGAQNTTDDLGLFDILNGATTSPPSKQFNDESTPTTSLPSPVNNTPIVSVPYNASQIDTPVQINTIPDDWDHPIENQLESSEVLSHEFNENAIEPLIKLQTNNELSSLPNEAKTDNEAVTLPTQGDANPNQIKDDSTFFNHLYKSLGLPLEYRDSVEQIEFANDLVQIINTSTQGIMALLAGRSVFKQESRLEMTMIKPQSNNPIKFSLNPSDTLEILLVKKKAGYMSAQASYSEAMNDIQTHQMAFLGGLQATLSGVLQTLDPSLIEQEVAKEAKSFIGLKTHAKKWQSFVVKQSLANKQVTENLNDVLSMHFTPTYEQYIKNAGKPNE